MNVLAGFFKRYIHRRTAITEVKATTTPKTLAALISPKWMKAGMLKSKTKNTKIQIPKLNFGLLSFIKYQLNVSHKGNHIDV